MTLHELPFNEENLRLLDSYSGSFRHAQFTQSSRWAEFQKDQSRKVILVASENNERLFLLIRFSFPLQFSYWYLPRAPFFETPTEAETFLKELSHLIKRIDSKALFVRLEPIGNFDVSNLHKTIDAQPSRTLVLSLEGPEEKILSQMHQKTRYNIRLAQKKNLIIKKGAEHVIQFLDLLEETRQRDGFRLHSRAYYEMMVKSNAVELVTAWHGEKLLAGSLLSYFGDTVTYVHGASSSQHRELMAPYFLHWQSIIEACSAGYRYYDWHGIDEKKWPGVTRFKEGFGGEVITYPGTFDVPLAPLLYAGYTVCRRLWRLM